VFYQQRKTLWNKVLFNNDENEDSDEEIQDPLIKMKNLQW